MTLTPPPTAAPTTPGNAGAPHDLLRFTSDNYHTQVYEALPDAMDALLQEPSLANQLRASVVYNMIVEGVLAETGYNAYFTILERNYLLPGIRKGISLLKQSE